MKTFDEYLSARAAIALGDATDRVKDDDDDVQPLDTREFKRLLLTVHRLLGYAFALDDPPEPPRRYLDK